MWPAYVPQYSRDWPAGPTLVMYSLPVNFRLFGGVRSVRWRSVDVERDRWFVSNVREPMFCPRWHDAHVTVPDHCHLVRDFRRKFTGHYEKRLITFWVRFCLGPRR